MGNIENFYLRNYILYTCFGIKVVFADSPCGVMRKISTKENCFYDTCLGIKQELSQAICARQYRKFLLKKLFLYSISV
jgi:hypothetical protein